jgi:hypothetical protein
VGGARRPRNTITKKLLCSTTNNVLNRAALLRFLLIAQRVGLFLVIVLPFLL